MPAENIQTVNNNHISFAATVLLAINLLIVSPSWGHDNSQGQCRDIEDSGERLTCFDQSHHEMAEIDQPTETSVYKPAFSGTLTQEMLISAFGLREKDLAIRIPLEDQLKRIESIIIKSEIANDGTYIMELENGQIWKENEPGRMKIKANQNVKISKNVLSYRMKPEKGRTVTVKRLK